MERGQDQRLLPLILEVMKQAGIDFNDLDRIAVTRGPGSFTGLRIGLAAARGIGLAAGKPVIGIDRFSIFREQINTPNNLLVVIASKRKELYCKFYHAQAAARDPVMWSADEIAAFLEAHPDTIIAGDIDVPNVARQSAMEPEVITCAALAAKADMADANFLPRPLYLRPPDVTMAKTPARSIAHAD